jgi:hypothetical protein
MYVLIPFNGMLSSNAGDDRIEHLLDIKTESKTPNKFEFNVETFKINEDAIFEMFVNIAKNGGHVEQKQEICNMSLDELLDKMIDQGIDSLTEIEKQKLEEYSK